MSTILHLETATKNCSVCIAESGKVVAVVEATTPHYSHSENLHFFVQQTLDKANLDMNAISAVAVSKGPGSYTGLRIGVAAAKGLCVALDVPLIAVNTLEVMAQKHSVDAHTYLVPMLDARRMEVYTMILDHQKKVIKDTWAEILTPQSFAAFAKENQLLVVGEGASKWKPLASHPNIRFQEHPKYPSAASMAPLAYAQYQAKQFESVAYFEPYYLKEFMTGKKNEK